ncbi:MAG: hypothetical protein ACMUIE_02405 [Thermoplasmatota archaeon]
MRGKEESGPDSYGILDARSKTVQLGGSTILVLGTIKGLLSEGGIVRNAFDRFGPDVIGIHIGREEIGGLRKVVEGKVKSTYLSSYEKIYARELSRFGEVQVPPPSLVEACRLSMEHKVPLKGLDMGDERYTELYTRYIDGVTMVRQSLRQKRVNRKKFKSATPEEFVLEWDLTANKMKGYRLLEERREKTIAVKLGRTAKKYSKVLAVLELERMEGILDKLDQGST